MPTSIPATAIPALYLKWQAVRGLLRPDRSDAKIGTDLWGPAEGPPRFSKMLRGDVGFDLEMGTMLAKEVNNFVAITRSKNKVGGPATKPIRAADFELPVFEFARRLIDAAAITDPDVLDSAHKALMQELTPVPTTAGPQGLWLRIERFATDKFIEGTMKAEEDGPPVFEIGRHKGLFAVEGPALDGHKAIIKGYGVFARDALPNGSRIWDAPFGDTVRWLPSPFVPFRDGSRILLFSEPKPVLPIPGRFHVMIALVFDEEILGDLDPRGSTPPKKVMDEPDTARFITNLNRVAYPSSAKKKKEYADKIAVCSGEYIVRQAGVG
jgi:hypothetical protein